MELLLVTSRPLWSAVEIDIHISRFAFAPGAVVCSALATTKRECVLLLRRKSDKSVSSAANKVHQMEREAVSVSRTPTQPPQTFLDFCPTKECMSSNSSQSMATWNNCYGGGGGAAGSQMDDDYDDWSDDECDGGSPAAANAERLSSAVYLEIDEDVLNLFVSRWLMTGVLPYGYSSMFLVDLNYRTVAFSVRSPNGVSGNLRRRNVCLPPQKRKKSIRASAGTKQCFP